MSHRRKPIIRASGDIADLCSKPQGRMASQEPCREWSGGAVLNAVIDAFSEPFAVADEFGRIVLKNIQWDFFGAKNFPCVGIEDDNDDDEAFMWTFGVVGSSLPDL